MTPPPTTCRDLVPVQANRHRWLATLIVVLCCGLLTACGETLLQARRSMDPSTNPWLRDFPNATSASQCQNIGERCRAASYGVQASVDLCNQALDRCANRMWANVVLEQQEKERRQREEERQAALRRDEEARRRAQAQAAASQPGPGRSAGPAMAAAGQQTPNRAAQGGVVAGQRCTLTSPDTMRCQGFPVPPNLSFMKPGSVFGGTYFLQTHVEAGPFLNIADASIAVGVTEDEAERVGYRMRDGVMPGSQLRWHRSFLPALRPPVPGLPSSLAWKCEGNSGLHWFAYVGAWAQHPDDPSLWAAGSGGFRYKKNVPTAYGATCGWPSRQEAVMAAWRIARDKLGTAPAAAWVMSGINSFVQAEQVQEGIYGGQWPMSFYARRCITGQVEGGVVPLSPPDSAPAFWRFLEALPRNPNASGASGSCQNEPSRGTGRRIDSRDPVFR